MMRIAIIGGTRFIGYAAVERLHAMGHELMLFHRGQTKAELRPGVSELRGDRHQLGDFAADFRRFAPDVVLDMCPFTQQEAELTLKTLNGITPRIVAISSQDVYRAYGRLLGIEPGAPDPTPLTEESPLRDRLYPYRDEGSRELASPNYNYEKILIERAVMGDTAISGTVLRLPMVYGPRDGQHRLFPYLKRMDDKRLVILLDEGEAGWRWTHGYVENVAAAIALAVTDERSRGRIYNVGESTTFSRAEWVRRIGQAAGWNGRIVTVPRGRLEEPLSMGIQPEQDLLTDGTRIRRELGYQEPVELDEALRRTVVWERANPPDKVDPAQFDYAAEDAILASLAP